MRLHHVQVACPAGGEDGARRFYGEGLGMTEVEKPADLRGRGGAWFRAGTAEIHIGVEEPFAPARKAHPALVVDDLEAVADRLVALGFEVDWKRAAHVPGPRAVPHVRRARQPGRGPGCRLRVSSVGR